MTTRNDIARIASVGLFGLLGVQGLWGAAEQFTASDTMGKMIQTAALTLYGASGIALSIRAILRKRRSPASEIIWSAGVILATGLAPSVWGDAPLISGIMSAGAGAVIVAFSLWMLRASRRTPHDDRPESP